MFYEVAIKGRYRRKRVVLGRVDLNPSGVSADSALEALGWSYVDDRLGHRFFEKNGYLVRLDDISVRPVKV